MAKNRKGVSVVVSPDFDDYASGKKTATQIRCALCRHCPCDCPPFGSPAYLALVRQRHSR